MKTKSQKPKEFAKILPISGILKLMIIPQIPHLEYRGIAVSIFNTAPRGIAVFTQPYQWILDSGNMHFKVILKGKESEV